MRILIFHSKKILAHAFASYLEATGHLTQTTNCIHQTPPAIKIFKPDIILIALTSACKGNTSTLKELKALVSPLKYTTVLLTDTSSWYQLSTSIQLGIGGIIHYDDELPTIQDCINQVKLRELYISPVITKLYPHSNNIPTNQTLTLTEIKIAKLLFSGIQTKEIAVILKRSTETIKNHRKSIKKKLCIKGGKLELLKYLSENGLNFK